MSQNWTPPTPAGEPATVPNYLVPAIISIFCCLPAGIAAIIFATQVNSKVTAGDVAGAQDSAKKAKLFSFIGIGIGIVIILIYVVMFFLGVGLSMVGNH